MNFNTYIERLNCRIKRYGCLYNGHYKKMALKLIFWNLKHLFKLTDGEYSSFKDEKFHVLFKPMGGIGDHFFFLKYYSCFLKQFSDVVVADILMPEENKELLPLYQAQKCMGHIFFKTQEQYDAQIQIIRFPRLMFCDWTRLSSFRVKKLTEYIKMIKNFYRENMPFYENDFLGREYSYLSGRTRENQADINDYLGMKHEKFSLQINENETAVLKKYHLKKNKFIVMQTGAGYHFKDTNDVRRWPVEYYTRLAEMLKQKYPDYQIIQAGESYQRSIKGTDRNLLGKTSLTEMLVLLKNAKLLIAQEGGYAICRHFIQGGSSVILFGPTNKNFFGFSENINISANVCPGCEWLMRSWYEKCVKTGEKEGVCMRNITPELVFQSIQESRLFVK